MLFADPLGGRVDEFGGYDGRFYQMTTWRWRSGDWHKLAPAHSPSARAAAVIGTDPVHKQTVLFGGLADVNPVNPGPTMAARGRSSLQALSQINGLIREPCTIRALAEW
jgi:hypothetical protein